jgi:hypothetical protein
VNHVGEIAVELAEQAGHGTTVALMLKQMGAAPRPFRSYGPVRVFRQNFALDDAIGSHACSLEALPCV